MATYKTPGVYVEEITKFPPSVAQVETAIPAFIGYTEKAEKRNGDSLNLTPTRITSLLEYETYFGGAKNETTIDVSISDTDVDGTIDRRIKVKHPTTPSPFLMYYSMQLYFANGGGPCYITSVGQYGAKTSPATAVGFGDLEKGLAAIRKEDEPTLLLFPDATNLDTSSDFYSIYNAALVQCRELQDRFTIIDTYSDNEDDAIHPIDDLRNIISSDKEYIKYGAAYYPYVETILDYAYDEDSILVSHTSAEAGAMSYIEANVNIIKDATNGLPAAVNTVFKYDGAAVVTGTLSEALEMVFDTVADGGMEAGVPANFDLPGALKTSFLSKIDELNTELAVLIEWKNKMVDEVKAADLVDDSGVDFSTALSNFVGNFEGTDKIEDVHAKLVELKVKLEEAGTATKEKNIMLSNTVNFVDVLTTLADYAYATPATAAYVSDAFSAIETHMDALVTLIQSIDDTNQSGVLDGRSLSDIELLDNAAYNKIKGEINALPFTLPPSSAMAGVYARTDAQRGVWKAPANTSLNYVVKPTVQISHEQQADLNVHTTGKSVNAIRAFAGKGNLVWGARTLAGNDNEWRYVPVRRFFNMVEESVSKATEQFVFEPNDANTWVRVRAMIENFLTLQWKAGALAGAKAEQAFYVRVGLGSTMTAQDVLEGRMIIEIGMAAVRPAEFIILRFSHKMQEA